MAGRTACSRGLAAYLLVVVLFTLPAWVHPTGEWIGGPSDPMKFMEFLGWYPFAITHGLNPLHNGYVNLPTGSNMMWDTTVPLVSIVLWPVTALFGVIASWNVAVLAALVLDGWCTFIWLLRHVRNASSAWVGGLVMVLGPYAAARAHYHLNLLLFFPVPLIFSELERLVQGGASIRPLLSGTRLGLLIAVEFLCSEELVALTVVAVTTVAVIGAVVDPSATKRLASAAKAAPASVAAFLLVAGAPVAYQFLGPGRISGPLESTNFYVTDALNFLVPNTYAALDPHFAQSLSSHWSGSELESDGYIGLPLLLVAALILTRYWQDRWVRVIGLGTLAMMIWSLGPYLHVNGSYFTGVPFPGKALAALPVLDNILPARFDLFTDFGLAALLAVFIDRYVLSTSLPRQLASATLLLLVATALAPAAPIADYKPNVPAYFGPLGGAHALPQGTVALVVPFGDNLRTMAPMLWQALSGFRIRMVSGAMLTAGPGGAVSMGGSGSKATAELYCAMRDIQSGISATPCGPDLVPAARSELNELGVRVIIMGPLSYSGSSPLSLPVQRFLSDVAGSQPRHYEGVLVWSWPGEPIRSARSSPKPHSPASRVLVVRLPG